MEKAEAKNYSFASVFSGMYSSHITPVIEDKGRDWQNEGLLPVGQIYLNTCKGFDTVTQDILASELERH